MSITYPRTSPHASLSVVLPHLYSLRVSIPAAMGVVWLVLTRLDLSRLAPSAFCFAFRFSPFCASRNVKGVVHNFPFNPIHWQVVVHALVLEDTPEQY